MGSVKRALKRNAGFLFVLPALLYMLVFVGYPVIKNIILSFQNVTVANLVRGEKHFVAFGNYLELFQDSVFRSSLSNTLLYTVLCLVFQFIIGFALALFFSKRFTFAKPIRGILLVPWMVPVTVTALICANVWIGIPFNMILISTGLTTIPKEMYESASIDGAGKVQSFFKITLPLLKPTIESVLILGFI